MTLISRHENHMEMCPPIQLTIELNAVRSDLIWDCFERVFAVKNNLIKFYEILKKEEELNDVAPE